jgi:hypothetical protein
MLFATNAFEKGLSLWGLEVLLECKITTEYIITLDKLNFRLALI